MTKDDDNYYNHYQVTTTLLVADQPLILIPQYLPSITTHIHMHTHYTSEGLGRIFLKWGDQRHVSEWSYYN